MKKAFTLIELLIVIAILGILAVGILIALDPIEQTRRATDSTIQQSALEIKNAVLRYYAAKLYFPWCTAASPAGGCTYNAAAPVNCPGPGAQTAYLINAGCGLGILNELVNTGELKTAPPASITAITNIVLVPAGTTFQMSFIPLSKSMKSNYTTTGGNTGIYTTTACPLPPGTSANCPVTSTTCAYCVF